MKQASEDLEIPRSVKRKKTGSPEYSKSDGECDIKSHDLAMFAMHMSGHTT